MRRPAAAGDAEQGPHLPAADDGESPARRGQRGVLHSRTRRPAAFQQSKVLRPWGTRGSGVAFGIASCLLASSWVGAYQEPSPLSDTEVNTFLFETGKAIAWCDARGIEQSLVPTARLRFQARGEPTVTMGVKEYLQDFRQHCVGRQETWDKRDYTVDVGKYRATVRMTFTNGSVSRFFILEDRAIERCDQTVTLIRYNEGIKIQAVDSYEVPSSTPVPRKWIPGF